MGDGVVPLAGVLPSALQRNGGVEMALERESAAFERQKAELLAQPHNIGKYALVIGDDVVGVFDHRVDAYAAGLRRAKGNVAMLIIKIEPTERKESLTSLLLGFVVAGT